MNKNELIKEILIKRARVSIKMSSIANDIASRGRRHDNSYTDSTELEIMEKERECEDGETKLRYQRMLEGIHANNNDYTPGFHNDDISEMNMIQLIELICHRVAEYDEKVLSNKVENNIQNYIDYVVSGLYITEELRDVIANTVKYVVNRNESIRQSLPKSANVSVTEVLEEGETNGESKKE